MCVNECVSMAEGEEADIGRKRIRKKRGKRRGNFSTGAQTAFGVLLEGHPFRVRVYLLHILFISVCSDWDSGAFKQLRHTCLMKQEHSTLR